MKTIAICMNVPELYLGGYRDPAVCKRFPGSGWVPHFVSIAEEAGYRIMSGHEAKLSADPKDTLVFREEFNEHGFDLVNRRATPWIVTSFESPLYSPQFYDEFHKGHFDTYEHRLTFSGGTGHLNFPIYEEWEVLPAEAFPWSQRQYLVMVAAHKFVQSGPDSPSFVEAKAKELQSKRYDAIEVLRPDVFGKGWGDVFPQCEDKIATMRPYKFAVCFENTALPGYVTEKIIDCFVAGVIPIYWGAPDIEKYIPLGTFIDMRDLPTWHHLEEVMELIDSQKAAQMIDAGRQFLKTDTGRKHSNMGFARWMLDLVPKRT